MSGTAIKTSIAPWLSVTNGAAAVDFYKAAFGAVELHRIESPTGEVVAQLAVDGAELWVSHDPVSSPQTLGARSSRMIFTVPDPDALIDRAVAAGATVVTPISEMHGWRVGRIADPFGHHWEIARPLRS